VTQNAETVWVVSFGLDETGGYVDYQIDEFDLREYPEKIAEQLRKQQGNGVFPNFQDAEQWARLQTSSGGCGGGCGGHGEAGGCGCPHKRVPS
jgi:hypothetical protein